MALEEQIMSKDKYQCIFLKLHSVIAFFMLPVFLRKGAYFGFFFLWLFFLTFSQAVQHHVMTSQ